VVTPIASSTLETDQFTTTEFIYETDQFTTTDFIPETDQLTTTEFICEKEPITRIKGHIPPCENPLNAVFKGILLTKLFLYFLE
jgi:hypothetical protein